MQTGFLLELEKSTQIYIGGNIYIKIQLVNISFLYEYIIWYIVTFDDVQPNPQQKMQCIVLIQSFLNILITFFIQIHGNVR